MNLNELKNPDPKGIKRLIESVNWGKLSSKKTVFYLEQKLL